MNVYEQLLAGQSALAVIGLGYVGMADRRGLFQKGPCGRL